MPRGEIDPKTRWRLVASNRKKKYRYTLSEFALEHFDDTTSVDVALALGRMAVNRTKIPDDENNG